MQATGMWFSRFFIANYNAHSILGTTTEDRPLLEFLRKFKLDMCEIMDQNRTFISLNQYYLIIKLELVCIPKSTFGCFA